jgi:hypothetical protein
MLLQSLLRPVLTPLMRGMFDAPIASSSAWSPLSLWPDGIATPGMWISPRDLTSQWQDSAGTTPVSVPGTVADSSNPVGLAYDLRAGTPVLGPQLITGTPAFMQANWTDNGGRSYASDGSGYLQFAGVTPGASYEVTFDIADYVTGAFCVNLKTAWDAILSAAGSYSYIVVDATNISFYASGLTATINNLSVKEVPGNHMLQSTSAARPLMSAYDGQTLGPGDTYSAAGYPVFQLYDGVDDGMATAAFSAGTLIDGMDCLIAVRRDSAAACVAGLYNGIADATKFFGMAESASGSGCVGSGAGTPTVWVDNAQLTGGTAVTRGTLHTALTVGDYHILEFRGLDLSTWTAAGFGLYTSYVFPGPRGDILLYPSTASTEDKDAARQYLATYYGVTLP